jgi:hypothetical protein
MLGYPIDKNPVVEVAFRFRQQINIERGKD